MTNKNDEEIHVLKKLYDKGRVHIAIFTTFGNSVRVEHIYNSRKLCKQILKKKLARELWTRMKNYAYYKEQ